jgi:hypothetical protein
MNEGERVNPFTAYLTAPHRIVATPLAYQRLSDTSSPDIRKQVLDKVLSLACDPPPISELGDFYMFSGEGTLRLDVEWARDPSQETVFTICTNKDWLRVKSLADQCLPLYVA